MTLLPRILSGIILVALCAAPLLAADKSPTKKQRERNRARSAAAKEQALSGAIKANKTRVQRAQALADAALTAVARAQNEAGVKDFAYKTALNQLEAADNEKFGASRELAELRAKIEKFQPDDSPVKQARREYDEATEELAEIRVDIYESDKYQALHERAKKSPDPAEELEKVTQICFDDDPEYKAAKERVENARQEYNQIRYALYEADAEWSITVERAKAAAIAQNRAATGVKASAVGKVGEGSILRDALRKFYAAQAVLADAKGDLKRLEGQQKKPAATGKKPATSTKAPPKKKAK